VVKLLGKMFVNEEQDEMRVDFQIKSMIGFKNLNETMDYESECKLLRIL
jgi:chemotaxis methyl-accepting protein methylase